jgi:hypothetical protein
MQLSLEIWEIFSEMQLFHQIPLACQTICEFSTFSHSLEQYDEDTYSLFFCNYGL